MTTTGWERLSDGMVVSTIAVLALALLAHTVENAIGARRRSAQREPVAATAGIDGEANATGGLDCSASTAAPDTARAARGEVAGRIGVALSVVGVALLLLAVLARGVAAQRVPWATMYEFTLTGAVAVGVAYLALVIRHGARGLGLWVVAVLLLALGLAIMVLYSPVSGLIPVLESTWLVVHVAAAITAGGLFTVGFLATAVTLVRTRAGQRPSTPLGALPDVVHTAHLVAFPIWTFAVLAGAIWAENAWGRYWGWDPKETWAFITWVFYAGYLHAAATPGWRATRSNWLVVAGYASFLFNFFGVNLWLPGLHSYAGV